MDSTRICSAQTTLVQTCTPRFWAQSKLYSTNEDKDTVWHSGVSIVIAATKYDAFKDQDPEVKKVRWAVHFEGV